jgi:hypothetical protein
MKNKINSYIKVHDTGAIIAFRSILTIDENQIHNRRLLANLMLKDYKVILIKGSFIECHGTTNAKEINAEIFFVIDTKNKGNLKIDLEELAQEFGEDSALFIPKGTKLTNGSSKVDFSPFVLSGDISDLVSPTNVMGKWAAATASKSRN